ncbi:transcriptional regulator [Actinospica robiniae DSM 44927]|uniref:Transcriptional regulator n=1 Tax=Actinospica robiniae DSM 44927 TaxID=479430 RepID=W9E4J2_9ACTN|nr:transcriptional regulator [Actinospica robiniae DSM 44927]
MAELLASLVGQAILFNEQVARALGIGAVDLQAFGVISRYDGPISPTEVAARTGLPASTTTRVLDRLEQAGYVVRSAVPGDRRKVGVEVVQEKAAEVARHYLGKVQQIKKLNAKRTDAEVAAVTSYLSELTARP